MIYKKIRTWYLNRRLKNKGNLTDNELKEVLEK